MMVDDILAEVLRAEGGYVNDPRDAGGETNFGITKAVARANGYAGAMSELTRDRALAIYRSQHVEKPGFGRVLAVSPAIAAEVVDTGINMGPAVAGRFLQRALNLLTNDGLSVDGVIGAASVASLRGFLKRRGAEGERRLLALLNAFQGARYADLAEGRAANRAFIYGWLARVAA
jgi:lysozyme family protein